VIVKGANVHGDAAVQTQSPTSVVIDTAIGTRGICDAGARVQRQIIGIQAGAASRRRDCVTGFRPR